MPAVTFLNIRRSERNEVLGRSAPVRHVGVPYFITAGQDNGSVVRIKGNLVYSLTVTPENRPMTPVTVCHTRTVPSSLAVATHALFGLNAT